MGEEAMPVVLLGDRVPCPVGCLSIRKDDACASKFFVVVAPDVPITLRRPPRSATCSLKPGMLIGCVIDNELGDDFESAPMRLFDEMPEVIERAVIRVNVAVVRDIVPVVPQRRGVERQ